MTLINEIMNYPILWMLDILNMCYPKTWDACHNNPSRVEPLSYLLPWFVHLFEDER